MDRSMIYEVVLYSNHLSDVNFVTNVNKKLKDLFKDFTNLNYIDDVSVNEVNRALNTWRQQHQSTPFIWPMVVYKIRKEVGNPEVCFIQGEQEIFNFISNFS